MYERQQAELATVIRELAVATHERNSERTRADDLTAQLAEANSRLEAESLRSEQLAEELALVRSRLQAVQFDARDATAAAEAARAAEARMARIATATQTVVVRGRELARTRQQLLDIANDQIDALANGQATRYRSLLTRYNGLIPTENRQVREYNAALDALVRLLD
jgi:hypothetical protein